MSRRLAIAVGRREVCAVGLERAGREYAIGDEWRIPRAQDDTLPVALERLCNAVSKDWHASELHLALSPTDLACADLLDVRYRNENQILRIAGSLAEGRCAGETVEELAIDVLMAGRNGKGARIQLGAMRNSKLKELRGIIGRLLPKASLRLVTPIPLALLRAVPDGDGLWGVSMGTLGEGAVWERKGGEVRSLRAFPIEGNGVSPGTTDKAPSLRVRDAHVGPLPSGERVSSGNAHSGNGSSMLERNARSLNPEGAELQVVDGAIPVRGLRSNGAAPDELAAVGVGLLNPQQSLNLLRGLPDAPRSMLDHIRAPLLATALAVTVLLVAGGLYFDLCAKQHEADLGRCREKEKQAWQAAFGSEPFREGTLASRLQHETARANKLKIANELPSALRLWGELGAVMPDVEQIKMKLEELHLTRRGGRLQAKVPATEGNPLQNASLIESSIDRSPVVSARGEFENRDQQISVRVQLDYQPKASEGGAR